MPVSTWINGSFEGLCIHTCMLYMQVRMDVVAADASQGCAILVLCGQFFSAGKRRLSCPLKVNDGNPDLYVLADSSTSVHSYLIQTKTFSVISQFSL